MDNLAFVSDSDNFIFYVRLAQYLVHFDFFLNQSSGPNTSSEPEDRVLRISLSFALDRHESSVMTMRRRRRLQETKSICTIRFF